MKPATEILLSAAFVLHPEENWTKGHTGRTRSGRPVGWQSLDACKFCAAGAVFAATGQRNDVAEKALSFLRSTVGIGIGIGEWNDTRTHAEVLAALYKAAELAESS